MSDYGDRPGTSLLGNHILRPHHTAVCVRDFDRALHFFRDIVGMRLEGEADQRDEANLGTVVGHPGACIRWGLLEHAGYRLELFHYYRPEGREVEQRQCDTGITHLAFEVDDVDTVCRQLRSAGFETLSDPLDLRGGRTRPVYVRGPEGVIVEFIEIRPE